MAWASRTIVIGASARHAFRLLVGSLGVLTVGGAVPAWAHTNPALMIDRLSSRVKLTVLDRGPKPPERTVSSRVHKLARVLGQDTPPGRAELRALPVWPENKAKTKVLRGLASLTVAQVAELETRARVAHRERSPEVRGKLLHRLRAGLELFATARRAADYWDTAPPTYGGPEAQGEMRVSAKTLERVTTGFRHVVSGFTALHREVDGKDATLAEQDVAIAFDAGWLGSNHDEASALTKAPGPFEAVLSGAGAGVRDNVIPADDVATFERAILAAPSAILQWMGVTKDLY